ncbi:hypothetical protein G7092_07535 [Mucilaginibacter sp. HC2]|uniref:hypothetical protein n=1 Tax=Mucilaginibacter inviolabilis TaxID=2714892 RepID=UPI00140C33C7|nr:hypothetical protein [Mucilaginibacter inviolabilis]NHA03640.1 hypothetical protein [Mucilaginibacter inviolabilis]
MTDDINEPNPPAGEEKPNYIPKPGPHPKNGGMKIVGINLLILVIYTILCKLIPDLGGLLLAAFLIAVHVFACIIMTIVRKDWLWILSAFLVLVIGFSTCVALGNIGPMH